VAHNLTTQWLALVSISDVRSVILRTQLQMTIPVYSPGWADVTNSDKDIASKISELEV
jgi:hypothetical protein